MSTPKDPRPAFTEARGSASGPRLRCHEKSSNHFYGEYKGHAVQVSRDHPSRAFAFLVIAPSGAYACDGIADKGMTMREVIIHAVKGALLWPNQSNTQQSCRVSKPGDDKPTDCEGVGRE